MSNQIISALERVADRDKEFMRELAVAFESGFNEFLEGAVISVENKDLTDFKSILHKIKPSFLTLGLEDTYQRISEFGQDLETRTTAESKHFEVWLKGVIDNINDELRHV